MRVVLMGPPGVGKGTQAQKLAANLGLLHVSTGDMLRRAVREDTSLGRRIRSHVESGRLVPDDLMGHLIAERLERDDAREGFVLDGFPRTEEQVTLLDGVLEKLRLRLDRVLLIGAPEAEIVRRLSGRRVCSACGALYHVENLRSASEVCGACGGALVQRRDDREEIIRERLQVYDRSTAPVAKLYGARSLLREVDGTGSPEQVYERLKVGLGVA